MHGLKAKLMNLVQKAFRMSSVLFANRRFGSDQDESRGRGKTSRGGIPGIIPKKIRQRI